MLADSRCDAARSSTPRPFGVLADGKPLDVSAGRSSALLAVLAMSTGKVVSVERLSDVVWGEDLPANARRSVQTYVTRLRSVLGADAITTAGAGYVLNVDPDDVDALRFQRLLDGSDSDASRERERIADALQLWRASPLGLAWRESVTLAHLGRVQRDIGRPDDARASWQQALALLDEVGEMDSTDLSRAELVDLIESGTG